MRLFFCAIVLYLRYGEAKLWSRGIVHYAINKKDFDPHSQEIILSTFGKLEKEICVKFFNTPFNHTVADNERILYISNPDKRKDCPQQDYDFDKAVVDMQLGYKCLNDDDISRQVLDMLRASVGDTDKPNSNDLYKTFQQVQVLCDNEFEVLPRLQAPQPSTANGSITPSDFKGPNLGTN